MNIFLEYVKSHVYEIHSLCVAIAVFPVVFPLERKYRVADGKQVLLMFLFLMAAAMILFIIVSFVSPFIGFSAFDAIMSGVYVICEYAFYRQITYGIKE